MNEQNAIISQLRSDLGGTYFPSFALKDFNKMTSVVLSSECGNVTMYTFHLNNVDEKYIKKVFSYCVMAYNYLSQKFYNGYYKSLRIVLILNNQKRRLPKIGNTLTQKNINGGFTTFSYDSSYNICVYRKEDCVKVLVHEIIHFFEVDGVNKHSSRSLEEEFMKYHNIHNSHYLGWFEAVTETYAVYLLCKFGYFDNEKITKRMLQVAGSYINHFYNDKSKNKIEFKETTHAYMYIIGRVSLWCLKCNDASKTFINIIEEERQVDAKTILDLITKANFVETYTKQSKKKLKNKYSKSLKIDYND